jgi:hypothetical protein
MPVIQYLVSRAAWLVRQRTLKVRNGVIEYSEAAVKVLKCWG